MTTTAKLPTNLAHQKNAVGGTVVSFDDANASVKLLDLVRDLNIKHSKRTAKSPCEPGHFAKMADTKRRFFCWRCSKSWSVVDFVMDTLGITTHEAGVW